MAKRRWSVSLSSDADRDYVAIISWTIDTFGPQQAEKYERLIEAAIETLGIDAISGASRDRGDDLGLGFRTLHLARPGRHFILYSVEDEQVTVIRILHDSMDVSRHLPSND